MKIYLKLYSNFNTYYIYENTMEPCNLAHDGKYEYSIDIINELLNRHGYGKIISVQSLPKENHWTTTYKIEVEG